MEEQDNTICKTCLGYNRPRFCLQKHKPPEFKKCTACSMYWKNPECFGDWKKIYSFYIRNWINAKIFTIQCYFYSFLFEHVVSRKASSFIGRGDVIEWMYVNPKVSTEKYRSKVVHAWVTLEHGKPVFMITLKEQGGGWTMSAFDGIFDEGKKILSINGKKPILYKIPFTNRCIRPDTLLV